MISKKLILLPLAMTMVASITGNDEQNNEETIVGFYPKCVYAFEEIIDSSMTGITSDYNRSIMSQSDDYQAAFESDKYFIQKLVIAFLDMVKQEDFIIGEEIDCLSWYQTVKKCDFYPFFFQSLIQYDLSNSKLKRALLYILSQFDLKLVNDQEKIYVKNCLLDSSDKINCSYALMALENWANKDLINDLSDMKFESQSLQRRFSKLIEKLN